MNGPVSYVGFHFRIYKHRKEMKFHSNDSNCNFMHIQRARFLPKWTQPYLLDGCFVNVKFKYKTCGKVPYLYSEVPVWFPAGMLPFLAERSFTENDRLVTHIRPTPPPSKLFPVYYLLWPLAPKFASSNPVEAVGFFGRKNPQHAFLRRGSKRICPMSQLCGM